MTRSTSPCLFVDDDENDSIIDGRHSSRADSMMAAQIKREKELYVKHATKYAACRLTCNRAQELVVFVVGAGNKGENARDLAATAAYVSEFREFRRRLVFFDYTIQGLLARTPIGDPVHLPMIQRRTMEQFIAAMTSLEGQKASFSKLDNLCTAYVVAKALFDDKLQQMVIEHIRERVRIVAKSDKRDELYEKLVEKVQWAWVKQSDGRIGLRRVLTASLAFICTGHEKEIGTVVKDETKEGKKRKNPITEPEVLLGEPVLRLSVLDELELKMGKHQWYADEFVASFMNKCVLLLRHNKENKKKEKEWDMLPAAKLFPTPEVVNLAE